MEVVNVLGEDKQNPFIEPPSYRFRVAYERNKQ